MKTRWMLLFATSLLASGAAQAADRTGPAATDAAWREECGSCHVAFPPGLLPASSWAALMAGLARHFGSDASLDATRHQEIASFLAAHAGRRESAGADGKPLLRITETPWFRREHRDGHDGITAAVWRSPAVKSASNCAACHTQAAQGDYSERNIRIPK